jgi:hypothetical protein
MQIIKLRFTVRRLMVAVAISGLLLGAGVVGSRWYGTRKVALELADDCAFKVELNRTSAFRSQADFAKLQDIAAKTAAEIKDDHMLENKMSKCRDEYDTRIRSHDKEIQFYSSMEQRFSYIASHPWYSLPLDELRSHFSPLDDIPLDPPQP